MSRGIIRWSRSVRLTLTHRTDYYGTGRTQKVIDDADLWLLPPTVLGFSLSLKVRCRDASLFPRSLTARRRSGVGRVPRQQLRGYQLRRQGYVARQIPAGQESHLTCFPIAYDHLVLEADTKDLVKALVDNQSVNGSDAAVSDVISGKGGGLICVLHGR